MDETTKKPDEEKSSVPLTRRELLLSLGSAVVLSGFRAVPLEGGQEPPLNASLPPGLHQPSFDHLTHALASEDSYLPIPPGCQTEYLRPSSQPFIPQAFAREEFQFVRRLVEIILGEDLQNSSAKPPRGAQPTIYDEVAEWIDLVVASAPRIRALARNLSADQRALAVACFGGEEPVRDLESFEPERICLEGLAWLREESQRRFAKSFLEAGPANQLQLVLAISDARPDRSATHAGTRLFDFLKAECIRGFYTSRVGLKELDYQGNSFFGDSPGCGLAPGSLSPPAASTPE